MAQVANTFETYDAVGNREELADKIYQITPDETPFVSLIGRKPVTEDYVPLVPWLGVMWWGMAAGQWALRVPSFTVWSAGIRYRLQGERTSQLFGLNVNNLFDVDYLKVNRQLGERRGVYFTYAIEFGGAR